MIRSIVLFVVFVFAGAVASSRTISGDVLKLPSDAPKFYGGDADDDYAGTRWAVLIAGSNGYWNYRHQVIPVDSFFLYVKRKSDGIRHQSCSDFSSNFFNRVCQIANSTCKIQTPTWFLLSLSLHTHWWEDWCTVLISTHNQLTLIRSVTTCDISHPFSC